MPSNAGTRRGAHLSSTARSISCGERDELQHIMECVDPHCCFCNDDAPVERDPEVQAWLDALLAQSEQIAA